MLREFVSDSTLRNRALQIYLVLIGLAWNRQTITYGDLSVDQLEYGHGGILAAPLGLIMHWCEQHDLPPLTSLVVNREDGLPGPGLITLDQGGAPEAQQLVFKFNWFSIFPPTVEELSAAS